MATHDYVIANGTGAAVRSDLNNALAAIVSNNSSSTEPGTTYAYQWWADTNANVLKIRNSSNDAWITLRELDGTMLIENGSASAPGLAFASDVDTGIFRSDSNKLNFATNGVERLELANTTTTFNEGGNDINLRVETSGSANMLFVDGGENRVGMGTDAPDDILHIKKGGDSIVRIENVGNGNASGIFFVRENSSGTAKGAANIHVVSNTSGTGTELIVGCGSNTSATGGERLRLDSSGRLLINHSASRSVGAQRIVQIEGTSDTTAGISILRNTNDSSSPTINLGKSRGTSTGSNTIVQDDDGLGSIYFRAADGTDINSIAASIDVQVDGTPGSNDTPGRIIFGTTADGASSPTTRMVIKADGRVGIGDTEPSGNLHIGTNTNTDGTDVDVFIGGNSSNTRQFRILKKIQSSDRGVQFHAATGSSDEEFRFYSNSSDETLRIADNGDVRLAMGNFSDTSVYQNSTNDGVYIDKGGSFKLQVARASGTPMAINRIGNDGNLISFYQGGVNEGSISVSSNTVSYNGGHLTRWSQLAGGAERTEILRGSVLSNLDEMCEWAHPAQDAIAAQDAVLYTEEDELPEGVDVGEVKTPAVEASPAVDAYTESNEQLNRMKVSDVEGDVNVAGVFQGWDDDDDDFTNDFYCAMSGDFIIRIAQGTTVARGDLLMSAGDGTAKPQDDDIVRSKTIAKVTSTTVSTTYPDGSYCVPCVLMAC